VLGIAINDWATKGNLSSNAVIIAGWETNYILFYSPGVKVLGWYGSVFPSTNADITSLVMINILREQARHHRVFMTRVWYIEDAGQDERVAIAVSVIASHFRIVRTNDLLFEVL
jgi:alcohol dehydrogenase YqhD (iron-dependent ADH family)